MRSAIDLLRGRLAWVQAQIAKALARTDRASRQQLVTAGRIDVWSQDEAWLVDAIRQLEAEQWEIKGLNHGSVESR